MELIELLHTLDEEYPEFVGHDSRHTKTEATEYIASHMGLDLDVAREVLEDLEAAGYSTLGPDPDYQRNKLLGERP
jgi:ribosomal protein S25